jgi:hypothetical protein
MTRPIRLLAVLLLCVPLPGAAGERPDSSDVHRAVARRLLAEGLGEQGAYPMLEALTGKAGHRLSGSTGSAVAVQLMADAMRARGLQNVRTERVMVPRWERGNTERAVLLLPNGRTVRLAVCALGGSIGTPETGITAEVLEVRSFEELKQKGSLARGKIIFFNRPMDPTLLNTFDAYGGAVDQRSKGAAAAARAGGVGAIVRSMTLALDDVPHTGSMGYAEGVRKIPAAAVSTQGANVLSGLLKKGTPVRLRLTLSCRSLPDAPSANVLGELRGSERPDEVIVVGGHLDAWDKGTGAHDDGAGCVQAIEALSLLTRTGIRPKRTIRAVMFMNEENGLRGGRAYAVDPGRTGERHIALIESDRGGFAPRGFTVDADSTVLPRVLRWQALFDSLDAGRINKGYSGVDISPMVAKGVPGFGLDVENQRYFDYHHSDNDTLDKVNPRELELGAIVQALLCYLIAEEGL